MKLLNHRFLSPETSTADDMIKLSDGMIKQGHRFLNMHFHSTSLLPGCSPFVQNDTDLDNFVKKIDRYLEYILENEINCIGLSQGLDKLFPDEINCIN